MARVRRSLTDIIYRLAPQFSRGALAFAPVAFPGRLTYTSAGTVGLDGIAPVQRQFILGDVSPPTYRNDTFAIIEPGLSGRFRQGTWRSRALMPKKTFQPVVHHLDNENPGGDSDFYDDNAIDWGSSS